MSNSKDYLPNGNYGTGVFRRRIRLTGTAGCVEAGLEDDFHAFTMTLHHDGSRVKSVSGEALRFPSHTCREAPGLLQSFAGRLLTADHTQFRDYEDPTRHCTHLHDLLWLAAAQALRPSSTRQYDVAVPDLQDGVTTAEVTFDDTVAHRWTTDLLTIRAPENLAGSPLQKGFSRWASGRFAGDLLAAAFVLQMGIFVARGRRHDVETWRRNFTGVAAGTPAVCHTFQPDVRLRYRPGLGLLRDFSAVPDRLLQFL